MLNKISISVIVPIYNIEQYIAECIKSITGQTYENIQIILVDDGSTDMSAQICDKYASLDRRIEVIHQCNKGLVSARKTGLKRAKGDYIGFVDGDDYIAADMYEVLLKEILRSDADFVHSCFYKNNEREIPFVRRDIEVLNDNIREELISKGVLGTESYITPSIWSKLFKADFIKRNYSLVPDSAQYGEDLICLCHCIRNCRKISLLDEAHYYYRYREDSIIHEKEFRSLENIFRYYMNVCNALVDYKCYEELKDLIMENACSSILNKINVISHNEFQVERYYYPYADEIQGKRIVIYGAGVVGKDYYAQISRYMNCSIVAWVDANFEKYDYPYIKLCGINDLEKMIFDILIIAVKKEEVASGIRKDLICRGVEENKICWIEPKQYELRRI